MPILGAGRPSRRSGAHPRRSRRTRRAGPARCGRHSRPSLHAPCSSRSGCPLPARRLAIFSPADFDQLHRRPLPLLARVARETAPGRRPGPTRRRADPRRHRPPGPPAAQARDLPSADAATSTCPIPSPVSAIRVPAVTVQSRLRTAATSTPPRRKVRSPPAHRTRTVSGAAAAGVASAGTVPRLCHRSTCPSRRCTTRSATAATAGLWLAATTATCGWWW